MGSWASEATRGGLLRVGTDEGAEGLALSTRPGSGPVLKDLVDRVLRRDMVGQDPFNRELLWHRMWELDRTQEIPLYLLGLPDIALWDLAGKVYSEPVWRLLGGARTQLPAYASTTTFDRFSSSSTLPTSASRWATRPSSCMPLAMPVKTPTCAAA